MLDKIINVLFITLLCLGIYVALVGGVLVSIEVTQDVLKLL